MTCNGNYTFKVLLIRLNLQKIINLNMRHYEMRYKIEMKNNKKIVKIGHLRCPSNAAK
jgi:hypothetical protein